MQEDYWMERPNFEMLTSYLLSDPERIWNTGYARRFVLCFHAFDYDMAFHYSYFEKNKDFFLGEYILGLGMILPRSVFPNKGNTLSNKLSEEIWCDGIGCKIDVGISPSMVTSAAAYWTYFAFPVLCFFIGYCGMLFWHQTVRVMNTPISLMVYSLGWPYVFTLFNDLNSFIASVLPILFTYFFVKILYEFLGLYFS